MSADNFQEIVAKLNAVLTSKEKIQQKKNEADAHISEITRNINNLDTASRLLEKQVVMGEIEFSELDEPRRQIELERGKLDSAKRLAELSREALIDADQMINQLMLDLKVARSQFCISRRDALFREIQNDQKLKNKLLESFVAYSSNGHLQYTSDWNTFIKQFCAEILPAATQAEIAATTEKFIANNKFN